MEAAGGEIGAADGDDVVPPRRTVFDDVRRLLHQEGGRQGVLVLRVLLLLALRAHSND